MSFDPTKASLLELFATYGAILRELRRRKIVRTENAPAGDFAEYLVCKALGGELAANSVRSYDLTTPEGRRVQVKCRVGDRLGKGKTQLSAFRSFEFDEAAIVLLEADYTIRRAVLVPVDMIRANAGFRKHVNGHVVHARPSLLEAPGTRDITELVQAVLAADVT